MEGLRGLVPPALSIDLFEGRAYVGVVPFTMRTVRFGPFPIRDFLEANVRTYVHADGVPGVWFLSLDAESAFAVWGAKTLYSLPYFRARMESVGVEKGREYRSERLGKEEASLDVHWKITDDRAHHAQAGTLEHFLTERYALYGRRGRSGVYRLRVHHPPWPLRRASLERFATTLLRAAGVSADRPIEPVLASPEGVAVQTFAAEPVTMAYRLL